MASRWLVWVIHAVCISLNAGGCFVQSRKCHDLFFVFSPYFAGLLTFLSLYFNASVNNSESRRSG